jgi:hypothetical protein
LETQHADWQFWAPQASDIQWRLAEDTVCAVKEGNFPRSASSPDGGLSTVGSRLVAAHSTQEKHVQDLIKMTDAQLTDAIYAKQDEITHLYHGDGVAETVSAVVGQMRAHAEGRSTANPSLPDVDSFEDLMMSRERAQRELNALIGEFRRRQIAAAHGRG